MDVYAIFGLFMLVGIVKKNGILQVDYTNELRRRGVPRDAAILQANRTRLRPILMTTLMLVAGMVPIALGQGPGAAARASLAKVIIGGQMLSLLPTLLITRSPTPARRLAERLNRRRRPNLRCPSRSGMPSSRGRPQLSGERDGRSNHNRSAPRTVVR
jgi:Cu/Ag efflux pump CusA